MKSNARSPVWKGLAIAVVAALAGMAGAAGDAVSWGEHTFCDMSRVCAVDLAANSLTSMAVKSDGTIAAWGNTGVSGMPPTGDGYIAVDLGMYHGIALLWDGSILCWGNDTDILARTPEGNDFIAVAAGDYHCLALRENGMIEAWGSNSHGQLDVPDFFDSYVKDSQFQIPYESVSACGNYSVGLLANGRVAAWGDNTSGQCEVPAGIGHTAISAGKNHGLALDSRGAIVAWGTGYDDLAPVPGGDGFLAVSAGPDYSLAVSAGGSLVSWGSNEFGQLNVPGGSDFIGVEAGSTHGLALREDGSVVGWGGNLYQQSKPPAGGDFVAIKGCYGGSHGPWWLGLRSDGTLTSWCCNQPSTNLPTLPDGNDFTAIDAERGQAIALRAIGRVEYWRCDGSPTVPMEGSDFVAVSAGGSHVLALREDGTIEARGDNSYGQLPPSQPDARYLAIAAGGEHSIALRADGSVTGWGRADMGQTQITGLGFIAIDAHENANLALHANGSLFAWGNAPPPPPGNDFVAISAGEEHCMALKSDGTVVEWGNWEKARAVKPSWVGPVSAIDAVHTSSAAVRGFFRPVAPTSLRQTVNIMDPSMVLKYAPCLEEGDEVAILDGETVVGSAILRGCPYIDPVTVHLERQRGSGYVLPGAVSGSRMTFQIKRAKTGQVLSAIATDLSASHGYPVFRPEDTITVTLWPQEIQKRNPKRTRSEPRTLNLKR